MPTYDLLLLPFPFFFYLFKLFCDLLFPSFLLLFLTSLDLVSTCCYSTCPVFILLTTCSSPAHLCQNITSFSSPSLIFTYLNYSRSSTRLLLFYLPSLSSCQQHFLALSTCTHLCPPSRPLPSLFFTYLNYSRSITRLLLFYVFSSSSC